MVTSTTTPPRGVNFGWIGQAWSFFASQAGVWIFATLIAGVISFGAMYAVELAIMMPTMMHMVAVTPAGGTPVPDPSAVMRTMMPTFVVVWIVIACLYLALNAFFGGGLLKMANKAVRGQFVELGDIFRGGDVFIPLLIGQLVFTVPYFVIGLAFSVYIFAHMPTAAYVPFTPAYWHFVSHEMTFGLIFDIVPLVLFALFWPAASITADGESPIRALGRSFQAMKRHWLMAALFLLVMFIILFLSAIPCGLGLLATVPVLVLISSLMYRDMVGMPAGEAPAMPGYYEPAPTGAWPPPPSAYPPANPPAHDNAPPGWPPVPPAGGPPSS